MTTLLKLGITAATLAVILAMTSPLWGGVLALALHFNRGIS